MISRRRFMTGLAGAAAALLQSSSAPPRVSGLYNGIRLPDRWPPSDDFHGRLPTPPYVTNPPRVIPIDVGRQLFVDDFLIEECSLTRSHHHARYIDANPVFRPSAPWERYDPRFDIHAAPRRGYAPSE